jgi:dodecin
MPDNTYKVIELVGESKKSFADATNNAIKKASKSLHGLGWFEIVQLRGRVENGKVDHYQAVLKVGFKLDE